MGFIVIWPINLSTLTAGVSALGRLLLGSLSRAVLVLHNFTTANHIPAAALQIAAETVQPNQMLTATAPNEIASISFGYIVSSDVLCL